MQLERVRGGKWQILALCSHRGRCPLLEFLDQQEGTLAKDARRMLKLLDTTADLGPPRNTDISHQLGPGLWEFIQGRLRVLWFYDRGRMVICSHGLIKKSRRIPRDEIARAWDSRRQYLRARRQNDLTIRG